jgi:GT2 family glycosyltransferase
MENGVPAQSSYDQEVRSSNWLKSMPFEHIFRNIAHEVFIRRLIQERWLFSKDLTSWPRLTIVIYPDAGKGTFERTFESCILQSALLFNLSVVCPDDKTQRWVKHEIEDRLRRSAYLEESFHGRITYAESIKQTASMAGDVENYLVCIKSGDVFHPSFVTSLYLEMRNSLPAAQVYLWNEMVVHYEREPKVQKLIRKPQLELYTLFHLNYVSYNFAVQRNILSTFTDFESSLKSNDGHLFLLSFLESRENKCATIPQYLLLRDSANLRENRDLTESSLQSYRKHFQTLNFKLEAIDGPSFYTLVPNKKANIVSVIIPFRDKPELTCQAIRSLFEQKVEALLEIILVNNQSNEHSIGYIQQFLDENGSTAIIWRFVNYDLPFNHSAQCNLGAREATGESLLFLNNDVEFISPDALMKMASWSLLPGIGTVGVRILSDRNGTLASAGIATRLAAGKDYNSMVEESTDGDYCYYNRETWGNTFACAAISKDNFNLVGALDEVNFPNGYNDVDYNMRCRKAGLRNIYLGTLCAVHVPGTTRGRSDEIGQKILLRRKYPEAFRDSLFQLRVENCVPAVKSAPSLKNGGKGVLYRALEKFGVW